MGGWQTRCYPVTKWRIWPRLLQISNLVHQINHVLCHIPDSTENNNLPGRALYEEIIILFVLVFFRQEDIGFDQLFERSD